MTSFSYFVHGVDDPDDGIGTEVGAGVPPLPVGADAPLLVVELPLDVMALVRSSVRVPWPWCCWRAALVADEPGLVEHEA